MSLVDDLLSGNLNRAKESLDARIREIFEEKLQKLKEKIVCEESGRLGLNEVKNIQRMGRTKLVRIRVRGGKVQRRRKISAVPGYTFRGGRLVRMSPQERRKRKLGARKAKIKRRSKINQILRKRKISLRKRRAMGVR